MQIFVHVFDPLPALLIIGCFRKNRSGMRQDVTAFPRTFAERIEERLLDVNEGGKQTLLLKLSADRGLDLARLSE
jgi:hypothetical protein